MMMKAAFVLTMGLALALSVPASADNGNAFGNDNGRLAYAKDHPR